MSWQLCSGASVRSETLSTLYFVTPEWLSTWNKILASVRCSVLQNRYVNIQTLWSSKSFSMRTFADKSARLRKSYVTSPSDLFGKMSVTVPVKVATFRSLFRTILVLIAMTAFLRNQHWILCRFKDGFGPVNALSSLSDVWRLHKWMGCFLFAFWSVHWIEELEIFHIVSHPLRW